MANEFDSEIRRLPYSPARIVYGSLAVMDVFKRSGLRRAEPLQIEYAEVTPGIEE